MLRHGRRLLLPVLLPPERHAVSVYYHRAVARPQVRLLVVEGRQVV